MDWLRMVRVAVAAGIIVASVWVGVTFGLIWGAAVFAAGLALAFYLGHGWGF